MKKMILFLMVLVFVCMGCSSSSTSYKILYGKTHNKIIEMKGSKQSCRQMGFYGFVGGGVVNSDGSKNKDLTIDKFQMIFPRSKKYDNYYYINAGSSPVKPMGDFYIYNGDVADQKLEKADFNNMKSDVVVSPSEGRFPSNLITSPGNRYLIYTMTKGGGSAHGMGVDDPFKKNSDLVIRDLENGEEKTVISGEYNRALFESLFSFSRDGKSVYTVVIAGEGFKFVKIDLSTGQPKDFTEIFPKFDWSRVEWDKYFKKRSTAIAHFFMSPDEKILLAVTGEFGFDKDSCVATATHKMEAFDIENDKIGLYSNGLGHLSWISWKDDSKAFAYILISGGGCYPSYIDAYIYKMDSDGSGKKKLVTEKKSKIVNLGWSPDGKVIAYSGYDDSFASWIKTAALSGKIKEVISTSETEGGVNKDEPVTLLFSDWVAR